MRRALLAAGLGSAVLAVGLLLVRLRLVAEVGVPLGAAWDLGLGLGIIDDLATALVPSGAALLVWRRWPRLAVPTYVLLASVFWVFSAANAAYFSYFGTRLERWVVHHHILDLIAIRDSIGPVVLAGPLAASVAWLVVFATGGLLWTLLARTAPPPDRRRATWVGLLFLLGAVVAVAGSTVRKHHIGDGSTILAEQVFVAWIESAVRFTSHAPEARRGVRKTLSEAPNLDPAAPGRALAELRDGAFGPAAIAPPGDVDPRWPLYVERRADPERTRAARARLGLPADGPIHVIILFLESVRAFEVQHPELGPIVFPHLRQVLATHGLAFPVAYSSAMDAGETVQGQLATLCSMLPNTDGAPAYVGHPNLRIRCLQQLFADNGYTTAWLSGGYKKFHNKFVFESLHGTQRFFDADDFAATPYPETFPACGYPDKPFLANSVGVLSGMIAEGRPLFASMLTLSTHHPVTVIAEGPVPEPLATRAQAEPAGRDYPGYLSRLRYLDDSLGDFFQALFAQPWADRTLVVVLGDHGKRYHPAEPLAPWTETELNSRIPLAFVTRDMPEPGSEPAPMHQLDVAPTVADVAGLSGMVTWLGRSVLQGPGSPWVIGDRALLHYRMGGRACYTLLGRGLHCYALGPGDDPLFSLNLAEVPVLEQERERVVGLTRAARQAITLNVLLPAPGARASR